MIRKTSILLTILFLSLQAMGQINDPPTDDKAEDLFRLGRQYLATGNHLDAALTFELVLQRPVNKKTTVSHYLAALSYFKTGERLKAADLFESLTVKYPKTRYKEEAQYHWGLCLLPETKTTDREKALDLIFSVAKNTRDRKLKEDALNAARKYMTQEYPLTFLDLYYILCDESAKPYLMEAILYHYDQQQDAYMVEDKLKAFKQDGYPLTPYISAIEDKYNSGTVRNTRRLNVAVMMTFNLQTADTATCLPEDSRRGVEFYEGMRLALDSAEILREVNLRVFDTRGDTAYTARQFDDLREFGPDLIIGEVRTSVSQRISKWAEKHKVPQIIVRNPLDALIKNKKNVFLMHSSLPTHGEAMADFAIRELRYKTFIVVHDGTYFSSRYAGGFKAKAAQLESEYGIRIEEKIFPKDYESAWTQVRSYVNGLRGRQIDAVYIPLTNQEIAGYFLSQVNYWKLKMRILACPEWENFMVIDPEIKTRFELTFTNSYHERGDTLTYDELMLQSLKDYGHPPTEYTVFGYDLARFLLQATRSSDPFKSVADNLREAPHWIGIHQDFYFNGKQDNQDPNVIQYIDGRTVKLNYHSAQQGAVRGGEDDNPGGG